MIAYALERGVQVSVLKLSLEFLHEYAGLFGQTAAIVTNRFPRGSRAFAAKSGYFRARHLKDAHLVFMAKPQQLEIHRRKACRPGVSRVLIEDAIDDGDKASASDVIRKFIGSSSRLD